MARRPMARKPLVPRTPWPPRPPAAAASARGESRTPHRRLSAAFSCAMMLSGIRSWARRSRLLGLPVPGVWSPDTSPQMTLSGQSHSTSRGPAWRGRGRRAPRVHPTPHAQRRTPEWGVCIDSRPAKAGLHSGDAEARGGPSRRDRRARATIARRARRTPESSARSAGDPASFAEKEKAPGGRTRRGPLATSGRLYFQLNGRKRRPPQNS